MAVDATPFLCLPRHSINPDANIAPGFSYLHGITSYGDNVEDEWLVVYLLRELTKSFPQLWVRVFDTDGEFRLKWQGALHRWAPAGYDDPATLSGTARVLTPGLSLTALRNGYRPIVHPSAGA